MCWLIWIEQHQSIFVILFTAVLALATILLWILTAKALQESRKATWGTIMLQANRDFFFDVRLYKVRKAIESEKSIFESGDGECTEQDVEDYIGYLDMLYGFTEQGILDFKIADDN